MSSTLFITASLFFSLTTSKLPAISALKPCGSPTHYETQRHSFSDAELRIHLAANSLVPPKMGFAHECQECTILRLSLRLKFPSPSTFYCFYLAHKICKCFPPSRGFGPSRAATSRRSQLMRSQYSLFMQLDPSTFFSYISYSTAKNRCTCSPSAANPVSRSFQTYHPFLL